MKFISKDVIKSTVDNLDSLNELNIGLSNSFIGLIGPNDFSGDLSKDEILVNISNYLEFNFDEPEDNHIWNTYFKNNILRCSRNKYQNNPYLKNIKISSTTFNNYKLTLDCYKPYEIFSLNDISVDKNYFEHTIVGYFTSKFTFPAINQDGITWMSVNPNEIETMAPIIDLAKGNVLVYGLGLGYFPYMISLKKEVNKITIIENDKNIIKLFKENILPQFNQKEKIEIVYGDALKFKANSSNFNFAFVDLWHDAEDGIKLFLQMKKREQKSIEYHYWLETSFYAFLRRAMISLIVEQFNDLDQSNYSKEKNSFDWAINKLYFATKIITINNSDDLFNLLTNERLLQLIKTINYLIYRRFAGLFYKFRYFFLYK